ncbi:hypothetical protein [Vibrio rotiferianus]|uniref:hypothetical protein n=1 Tax=Vibrio rotiferianus TaxID=190895 RepID=UPI00398186DF
MTAEVVIFNKSAIALAADSAVSIEGNKSSKIYNNAEKLFALSKYHPVAIMIYERNELQGVPWELIIKAFRKKQGDKCYSKLSEYKDAFLDFSRQFYFNLPRSRVSFWAQEAIREHVYSTLDKVLEMVDVAENDSLRVIDVFDIAINDFLELYMDAPFFEGLDETSLEDAGLEFDQFAYQELTKCIDTQDFSESEDRDWMNTCNSFYVLCCARLLRQDPFHVGSTGLVFAGYGEDEYFPEICECEVYGAFNGVVKVIDKTAFDGDGVSAGVKAFAQREEVNTFMEGVSNSTKREFVSILKGVADLYSGEVYQLIDQYVPEEERHSISAIIEERCNQRFLEYAEQLTEHTNNTHVNKVVEMIAHLPKNELAYMAESLVNLTAFKRKVSYEMDSVGGPIDVAVISKGDGLVWIKRKHYFPTELNSQYGPSK